MTSGTRGAVKGGDQPLSFTAPRSRASATSGRRVGTVLSLLLAFLPVAGAGWAHAGGDAVLLLTVTTTNGEVLVSTPLPPGATWRIEWRHSVAQVQIVDVFAWRDGVLYVTDEYTPYLDIAGLGNFDGRGTLEQLADGSYHLSDIDLALHGNAHDLIIGSERAPTVLVVGEDRFALSETHPATHARIEVKQR